MRLEATGKISAIAIDCEMVGVQNGRQTLAFLSAVNVLTGEVLISRYVVPDEDVIDWRFKFSGLTQAIMTSAAASGAAFGSWREARDKLLDFMDDSTVLVGHSLNYDLEVLGVSHPKVVDSAILTAETVYPSIISTKPLPRMWGLKTLAKDLLSLKIQDGNQGHNALEDAYAARDVLIWCIRNPEELKVWAENARLQEKPKLARSPKKHGKSKSNSKLPATQSSKNWESYDSDNIRWSDLADELGWPKGYDPWSD
jgi:DNA polymerase III epsilon subunit-like protein